MKTIATIYLSIICGCLLSTTSALAKVGKAPLDEKCKRSDGIALVEIIEIRGDPIPDARTRQIATARVVTAIKGFAENATFQLEFDNGFLCPNVLYAVGEQCLVFVTKLANGNFETFNYYYGKCGVIGGVVKHWWENGADTKWDDVVTQIEKYLGQKSKKSR